MKLDLSRCWYQKSLHPCLLLLLPFSWLFGACAAIRRWLYRAGWLRIRRFNVPVIVVGNISVGGTGKTPFVIRLVQLLESSGYRPGLVSRGVGGRKHTRPRCVRPEDTPHEVGDEAVLLVRRTGCPLVVGVDRVAAVRELLRNTQCNIVISDDGLQHYRLGRDLEVVVVDGVRGCGNGYLLPAGPLREPKSRLGSVDFVVVNGGSGHENYAMTLEPSQFISVRDADVKISLADFPRDSVHAVAGIGHPERFFKLLSSAGFAVTRHVFPDHHLYQARELNFNDTRAVIMTEKDAVKCAAFANDHFWYLSITAKINVKLEQAILTKLKSLENVDDENDFAKPACVASCPDQHDGIRG
ncbi:Tetraacyldisaccharide 4'-kinase [Aquicella siphonis]|uniref:Tetraacyldisaccharide 4'-kinase n=1 Tax=Aquicella siphonis TaxID=254247 RepID=A0A5E4PIP0_9COXI|nr:tetraacyldisaccharide 4'-kinase [Aquicella siphonis]VVC76166.1 Tetraacyldisaccharide 4'-kinase [Aquicella siphonis]